MGWWQDVKDNYNYYTQLKQHQQEAKNYQSGLTQREQELDAQKKIGFEKEAALLDHRDEVAREYPAPPVKPARTSWLGKMWARMTSGSTDLPPKEQEEYTKTNETFSNSESERNYRESLRGHVQDNQNYVSHVQEHAVHLKQGEDLRQSKYSASLAEAGIAPDGVKCTVVHRLGPSLMDMSDDPRAKEENLKTAKLMKEYSDFAVKIGKKESLEGIDVARYGEVTVEISNRLVPLIEQGNRLHEKLTERDHDELTPLDRTTAEPSPHSVPSFHWLTPELGDDIRKQYQTYMALSDFVKKPGTNGCAAARAFGSVEAAEAYQASGKAVGACYMGARSQIMKSMEGGTLEQYKSTACSQKDVGRMADEEQVKGFASSLANASKTATEQYNLNASFNEDARWNINEGLRCIPTAGKDLEIPKTLGEAAKEKAPEKRKEVSMEDMSEKMGNKTQPPLKQTDPDKAPPKKKIEGPSR